MSVKVEILQLTLFLFIALLRDFHGPFCRESKISVASYFLAVDNKLHHFRRILEETWTGFGVTTPKTAVILRSSTTTGFTNSFSRSESTKQTGRRLDRRRNRVHIRMRNFEGHARRRESRLLLSLGRAEVGI